MLKSVFFRHSENTEKERREEKNQRRKSNHQSDTRQKATNDVNL